MAGPAWEVYGDWNDDPDEAPHRRLLCAEVNLSSEMAGKKRVVHSDPEIMSGTPVFVGTRVPVKNLFDYLEEGDSLDDFLESFPPSAAHRRYRLWSMREMH